jgi:putative hydrolases of HD superfamily
MLEKLFNYFDLLRKFQRVERQTEINGIERKENDAEHSYQVAMVAWYLAEKFELGLDTGKLVKYALVHDMVEIYAGDTGTFNETTDRRESKQEREQKSLERISKEMEDFASLIKTLQSYEEQQDAEAVFVKAVDKIVSPVNIYMDKGHSWQQEKVTFADFLKFKEPKMYIHPVVAKLYEELKLLLEKDKDNLFYKQVDE